MVLKASFEGSGTQTHRQVEARTRCAFGRAIGAERGTTEIHGSAAAGTSPAASSAAIASECALIAQRVFCRSSRANGAVGSSRTNVSAVKPAKTPPIEGLP